MTTNAQRWTRERAKSGPADTLDGRYEVVGRGPWRVRDRHHPDRVLPNRPTMRQARELAESIAASDSSPTGFLEGIASTRRG